MKKNLMFGFIWFTLFTIGCKKEIGSTGESLVFTSKTITDTIVWTPSTAFLYKGNVVNKRGSHTINRAVVTVTRSNGFLITDIKDLKIRKMDNGGQVFERSIQTVTSSNSFELGLPFIVGQSAEIEISATLDPVHNGQVQVDVEFFYSSPSGIGSKKLSGPRIRCETSTVIFTPLERKPIVSVLTSSEPEVFAFSLKSEGLVQKLNEIVFAYNGTLGHETISRVMLFTKQGVKVAEAANASGVFRFNNLSDNLSSLKEYIVKAALRQGIRTGDRWTVSLVRIETQDTKGDKYEIKPLVQLPGNEFVTFASLLEVKTNPLSNTQARNGEVVLASQTFTSKGGSTSLVQFKKKIAIANNGPQDTIDIRNFKLRIGGVMVPATQVFFSKPNGDSAKVYTLSDEMVYITLLGGRTIPADQSITVEFVGTLRGIGEGDAVSTFMVIDDVLDLDRRHITRAPNQHVGRLHTSSALSANGVLYDVLWSDRSAPNHSVIFGISSADGSNGRFIDKKDLYASVLQ